MKQFQLGISVKKHFLVSIFLILLSVITLFCSYRYFDYKSLPLAPSMNDQYNYLTYARNVATHNGNFSNLNYPTVICNLKPGQTNLFYKPLYPYVISFIYRFFGVSDFTSVFISLLSYILSILLIYHISLHFFRNRIAICTALSFMIYAIFIKYSLSAMMESFFVFSCLLGFYLFIKSPRKWNFLVASCAVAIAFSVRETGLFLLPGYFFLAMKDSGKKAIWFVFTSTILILISNLLSDGQPSLLAQNIIASATNDNAYQIIYTDNTYVQNITITPQLILKAILMNCKYNLIYLVNNLYYNTALGMFAIGLGTIFIYLLFYKTNEKNRKFYIFTLIISACIFLVTMLLYRISCNRGERMFLFTNPFIVISCWGGLYEFWQRYLTSSKGRFFKQCFLCLTILLFVMLNRRDMKNHRWKVHRHPNQQRTSCAVHSFTHTSN